MDNEEHIDCMQQFRIEDATVAAGTLIQTIHANWKKCAHVLKHFAKDASTWEQYVKAIEDHIVAGFVKEVDEYVFDNHRVYYILYRAIYKESSSKLRIIFVSSSSTSRSQRDAILFPSLKDPFSPPTRDNMQYYLRYPNSPLSKEIKCNTYVENVAFGAATHDEAIKKSEMTKSVFGDMHMYVSRQFVCNSKFLNNSMHKEDRVTGNEHSMLLGMETQGPS
ncbi:unnamed protein product [Haemonchus placei]|uniref:START domain-containing protein n=1 Tax=Haemonchus placei TaxID=6290 RepID=A0A0N4WHU0_HAEPC|nr:unnamed protein product [Haemonchus placei]